MESECEATGREEVEVEVEEVEVEVVAEEEEEGKEKRKTKVEWGKVRRQGICFSKRSQRRGLSLFPLSNPQM